MGKGSSLCPLMVERKTTSELIKPSKQTPSETLSLSTLDNDHVNEVMFPTVYVYRARKDTSRTTHEPECLLREALSDLLVYYYPLSGKLMRRECDSNLQLRCNAEGVPFTVATANRDLSSLSYLENIDFEATSQLVPRTGDENYDREIGYHPFALQVTKFPCGGFTIGTTLSHAVCDGTGAARFISALMELAAGKNKPSVEPIWERNRLLGIPDDRPAVTFGAGKASRLAISPYMPSQDMISETINVKADSIKRLKQDLLRESDFGGEILTTVEVLGAYIWRSRTRALKLNQDGVVLFGLVVAIGQDMDPPLPEGYYGNSCLDTYVELTAREVHESPISDVVKLVKEAKRRAREKEFIEEELGNKEKLMKMEAFSVRKDGVFVLADLRNIGLFGSTDFGWGEAVNFLPVVPPCSAARLGLVLQPSKTDPSMEGGVKVVMTMPRDAMRKVKQDMESLNNYKLGDGA